jgi:tRNA nucleotidyltransferase (CCA-adding enzyme)
MLLFEAEESQRREILLSLKCSNRQRSGALAVAEGAAVSLSTRAEVSRFLAKYGRDASDALCASVLLGNSDESVFSLAEQNDAPRGIGDLAVGGGDMVAIGLRGKEIGEMLSFLLDIAIDEPSKNNKESLLQIAESEKNKIKDRNKNA